MPAPAAQVLADGPSAAHSSDENDARFMRLALALAQRHLGQTWPNPSVGCVIVRDDGRGAAIVATGITQRGGRPHAERVALAEAGEAARGATLYVSLEPCSHHGRTPPCAEAIVEAGVARVVSATEDPDPRVAGRGHTLLRKAGIAVSTGVLEREARRLNRGHMTRVRAGRPAVTLKLARTADGFAGSGGGERLLITGTSAQARIHLMRAHADAIMVGVGTVLSDDPQLTVRLPGLESHSPVRVVLDSRLRTPSTAQVLVQAGAPQTWIVASAEASPEAEGRLRERGAEILRVPAQADGRVDPAAALRALAERRVTRVFCEGGPTLAEDLARQELVDEIALVTAPTPLGLPGQPALGPALQAALAHDVRAVHDEMLGPDRLELFERIER